MSFTPHPVIPQTREQAIQRDHLHGIAHAPPPENPAVKAARLEQAIRGEVHGRLQTMRGMCTDEEPHEQIDAKLAELDELIYRLAFPDEPPEEDG